MIPPPAAGNLGTLTSIVSANARGLAEDGFLGWQVCADEMENQTRGID